VFCAGQRHTSESNKDNLMTKRTLILYPENIFRQIMAAICSYICGHCVHVHVRSVQKCLFLRLFAVWVV
jgi:hypothetical protein